MAVHQFEMQAQQVREQAARNEAARKQNVETFTRMFLTLGADSMKLTGTSHDVELLEARGLAASRWNQLVSMEAQVVRDDQTLAARPKKRPSDQNDWRLPKEAVERMDREYDDQIDGRRRELAALKALTKNERAELESFIRKGKK